MTNTKRITNCTINFTTATISIHRTDNNFKCEENYANDRNALHKRAWYIAHSPKLLSLHIITKYYSKDVRSLTAYCNMENIPVAVSTPTGIFHNTAELDAWFSDTMYANEMSALERENIDLIIKYAKELIPYLRRGNITEVLESQIRLSGYDVSLSSEDRTDGLNSGVVETNRGKESWSRTYTKHYTRYNTQLNDLLKMYISCKWYKQHNIQEPNTPYGVGLNDVDSYTGASIKEPVQVDLHREDVVVPVSACGEYTQMLLN